MHHTIDKIPNIQSENKYSWQKKHAENKTGSEKRYKSFRIKKESLKKKYETWKETILDFDPSVMIN